LPTNPAGNEVPGYVRLSDGPPAVAEESQRSLSRWTERSTREVAERAKKYPFAVVIVAPLASCPWPESAATAGSGPAAGAGARFLHVRAGPREPGRRGARVQLVRPDGEDEAPRHGAIGWIRRGSNRSTTLSRGA
jgi:hypothetical protein